MQRAESDPPRGARSGWSSGSLGASGVSSPQPQNARLWGLQVNCSRGTERRKSHHRTRRDYRPLNAEDQTFRLAPRNAPHANEAACPKEREAFCGDLLGRRRQWGHRVEKQGRSSCVWLCLWEGAKACVALRPPDGLQTLQQRRPLTTTPAPMLSREAAALPVNSQELGHYLSFIMLRFQRKWTPEWSQQHFLILPN